MKKGFLLISMLMMALVINAADQYPDPTVSNSLSAAVIAVGDGETIYLDDAAPYVNSKTAKHDYTKLRNGKNITIRAIEGKSPIVRYEVPFQVREAVNATFIGVKFDGTSLQAYDHYFSFYDNANNVLEFEDCEFINISKYIISVPANNKADSIILTDCNLHDNTNRGILNQGTIDALHINNSIFSNFTGNYCVIENYGSGVLDNLEIEGSEFANNAYPSIHGTSESTINNCTINNCYFHDNSRSSVFVEQTASATVSITNSTFANIAHSNYSAGNIDVRSTSGTCTVDHCTFYNVQVISTDFAAVCKKDAAGQEGTVVSNCIFMLPESQNDIRAIRDYKYANNCLTYNYTKDSNTGIHSGVTQSNCLTANPCFADAANNDFTLLNASSARRENGDIYGDPRWAQEIQSVAIPTTLLPNDAILSDSAGVVEGETNKIDFKVCGSHAYNSTEWAKWKVTVAKAGKYTFTANVTSTNSQKYTLSILDSDENAIEGGTVEQASNIGEGAQSFSTNELDLAKGTYYVKIINTFAWSDGCVVNVIADYLGGAVVEIPATLQPVDALRSELAFINDAGELRFTDDDHTGNILSQWGKWNIHVAKGGTYNFTLNANSTNSHHYKLYILNPNESQIMEYTLDGSSGTPLSATTDNIVLDAGDYIIKIMNTTEYSTGRVISIVANYMGGAVTEVPGQLLGQDALLYSTGSKSMIRLANGSLQSSDNADPTSEYAIWNITATAGTMVVTLNLDTETSSGHNYRVELYQDNTLVDYAEELESAEASAAVHTQGDVELTKNITIATAGSYTIKLVNRTQYSTMILNGITFAPYVAPTEVTMSETDTNNSAWIGYLDGDPVNVTLTRTFKGGVYNSICVPFAASMDKIKAAFGDDVELVYMSGASLDGGVLNLQFSAASDIYQGTPYLIKPSADVENPFFDEVNLLDSTASSTSHEGWGADFIGTFVKKNIAASENNLYLGSDNKLYFSPNAVTIKGLRAYFKVNVSNPSQVIQRARIVVGTEVATDVELITNDPLPMTNKLIRDGQLIIIRNGVEYNAAGQLVK